MCWLSLVHATNCHIKTTFDGHVFPSTGADLKYNFHWDNMISSSTKSAGRNKSGNVSPYRAQEGILSIDVKSFIGAFILTSGANVTTVRNRILSGFTRLTELRCLRSCCTSAHQLAHQSRQYRSYVKEACFGICSRSFVQEYVGWKLMLLLMTKILPALLHLELAFIMALRVSCRSSRLCISNGTASWHHLKIPGHPLPIPRHNVTQIVAAAGSPWPWVKNRIAVGTTTPCLYPHSSRHAFIKLNLKGNYRT